MKWAALLAILLCGCPDMGVPDNVVGVLGLWTDPNDLSAPRGALHKADNIVIQRPGVAETRRGFTTWATALGGAVNRLIDWKDTVLAHYGASTLAKIVGGVKTNLDTAITPPSGHRVRFQEMGGSLYMTTEAGVKKLDLVTSSAGAVLAGGPKAVGGYGSPTGSTGFLTALRSVAYRVVWTLRDGNDRFVTGAPSHRIVVRNEAVASSDAGQTSRAGTTVTVNTAAAHGLSNGDVVYVDSDDANFPAGNVTVTVTDPDTFTYTQAGSATSSTVAISFAYATRNASVTVPIPHLVSLKAGSYDYFAEVFRAEQTQDEDGVPSDELYKVYEYLPNAADRSAGSFTFTDTTPELALGEPLYTSPSQEGLEAANEPLPVAKDLAAFGRSMWYANTARVPRLLLQFNATPSVGTVYGLSASRLEADDFEMVIAGLTLTAAASENIPLTQFQVFTAGTASQNIENTARSFVKVLNANAVASGLLAQYVSGPDDSPGRVLIERNIDTELGVVFETESFQLVAVYGNGARVLSPVPPQFRQAVGASTTRVGSTVTVTTSDAHGYVVGQQVALVVDPGDADPNFPAGLKTIATTPSSTTFTYTEAGNAATLANDFHYFRDTHLGGIAETEVRKNGWYYSKSDEPESVPLENAFFPGNPDKQLLRSVRLGTSLFGFKEGKGEGLWRATGTGPENFDVNQVDPTCELIGPDTVAELDGTLFALTRKGVVRVTESGLVVDSKVEPTLGLVLTDLLTLFAAALSEVKSYAHAVAYETEGLYVLWLPTAAGVTTAGQAYVYSVKAKAWTKWTRAAHSALIHPTEDKLYLGLSNGNVSQERKARAASDHQDESGAAIAVDMEWAPFTGGTPGALKHWREVAFQLQDATGLTGFNATFATEVSTSQETQAVTVEAADGPVRVGIPEDKLRSSRLTVGLERSVAQEKVSVAGFTVLFNGPTSQRVTK